MLTPSRGRCLVKRVETQESYGGSNIVLPEAVRDCIAAQQVEILAVGRGAFCDDEECQRPHCYSVADFGAQEGEDITEPLQAAVDACATGDLHTRIHSDGGLRPGDWVLVAPRSLVECGDPEGKTFLVRQDDVIAALSI